MEIIITPDMGLKGTRMLQAMADTAPMPCRVVTEPSGSAKTLMIYGPGHPVRKVQAEQHAAAGGRLVLWDIGYFAHTHCPGAMRLSIDHGHPQGMLDRVPLDGSRWDALGVPLRQDYQVKGPILLIGLGPKARATMDNKEWERQAFAKLRRRFPRANIVFRPKPNRPHPMLPCRIDGKTPIDVLLRGVSLVVCKHSNVAVDATVAGVPFECSDGAACWLHGKPYSPANRLEFLRRLMWFNWHAEEAAEAWKVIQRCCA